MVKSLFPAHVETQWKYLDFMEILFIAALNSWSPFFIFPPYNPELSYPMMATSLRLKATPLSLPLN